MAIASGRRVGLLVVGSVLILAGILSGLHGSVLTMRDLSDWTAGAYEQIRQGGGLEEFDAPETAPAEPHDAAQQPADGGYIGLIFLGAGAVALVAGIVFVVLGAAKRCVTA